MSSLAAVQADGYYRPPDYNPRKRQRPKQQSKKDGLTIRFEMPFKVWCLGCDAIVAKGVRFNADKRCVGNYFTTKIWEFSMKCYHCDTIFKVTTDPKSCEYLLTSGLRRKIETFDAHDAETVEVDPLVNIAEKKVDPMAQLEKSTAAQVAIQASKDHVQALHDLIGERAENSYELNSELRKRFRKQKKILQAEEEEAARSKNFAFPLLAATQKETAEASEQRFIRGTARHLKFKQAAALRIGEKVKLVGANPSAKGIATRLALVKHAERLRKDAER